MKVNDFIEELKQKTAKYNISFTWRINKETLSIVDERRYHCADGGNIPVIDYISAIVDGCNCISYIGEYYSFSKILFNATREIVAERRSKTNHGVEYD